MTTAAATSPRRLIAVTVMASGVTALPFSAVAAMAVQVRADLGFAETSLGLLLALFSIGALLWSPAAGVLIERVGPPVGVRIAVAITAVGALGISLLAHSWWTMALLMMLCGTATAMSEPATNLWISRAIPARRHGTALGLKQSSGPLAGAVAGLLVPLIALTVGWRWAGVLIALVAVALAMMVPTIGSTPRRESATASTTIEHRLPLALLMTAALFAYIGQASMHVFFVSSAVESGTSEAVAGVLLTVGSIAAVATRLTVGISVDRRPRSLLGTVTAFLIGGTIACGVLSIANPITIIVLTPLLYATSSGWAGIFHLAAMHTYPNATAKVTGLVMAGAYAGVVIGPISFGAIASDSYAKAWTFLAISYLTAAGVVLAARAILRSTVGAARIKARAAS